MRAAQRSDGPAVASLTAELGYDPAGTGERLAAVLDRGDAVVFVAVSGGDGVVGWIHVHETRLIEDPPFAEIGGLVVAGTHHRRGVGTVLLEAAEDWARGRGLGLVRLRSNQIRSGAHAFYRARGYEVLKTSLTFQKRC